MPASRITGAAVWGSAHRTRVRLRAWLPDPDASDQRPLGGRPWAAGSAGDVWTLASGERVPRQDPVPARAGGADEVKVIPGPARSPNGHLCFAAGRPQSSVSV